MTTSGPVRVIVAEDEPTIRQALGDLIRSAPGLELVGSAADAAEATTLAAATQPDVAVVDVRMPAGGGPVAARAITQRSPRTRVLALSASNDRASVVAMLDAGAAGYLIKGSDPARIVESIESAAEGRATLSSEVAGEVIDELVERRMVDRHRLEERRRAEERIARALAEPAALQMVFQPICALGATLGRPGQNGQSRIIAFEALARFAGPPDRSPDRWFSEAHRFGRGDELELAAVRLALEQLPLLPGSIALSVNISPDPLRSAAFDQLIAGTQSHRVIIEITEHARIDDYAQLAVTLGTLRGLGVRVAIDDAGAGFASLRHILRLGPQFIKLDRTLIEDIGTDRSRQALAAGLISFADKTGATIIAEGIEREEEIAALQALGVEYGQGFFLGEPAPVPVIPP